MTTDTETLEPETDTVGEFFAERRAAEAEARREPQPSDAYDDCWNATTADETYKALFSVAQAVHGSYPPAAVVAALQEDHRRAMVRLSWRGAKKSSGTPVVHIPLAAPIQHEDGAVTIKCVGPCGEEKPENKFPTIKPGIRSSECRDCNVARRKAAKG